MDINNAKILICDDSILARKQLSDILKSMGTPEIHEAEDGQKAVSLYKEIHPDIVFLDIVMPNMDGNIAIKEIMKQDPDAIIVVVSSVGTQSELRSAIEAGAKDFIQKPLNEDQVIVTVNKFLEGR